MATKIISGEQYPIPFVLRHNNIVYTPDNISAVRIKIGKFSASYPDGNLEYRNNAWQFPLTQEMSYQFKPGEVSFQVQGKDAHGNVISSDTGSIVIGPTMFGGAW